MPALSTKVPVPSPQGSTSAIISTNRTRSEHSLLALEESRVTRLAEKFKAHAQVIRAPFTRESLAVGADVKELEQICSDVLGPDKEAQHLSAQIIDKEGKPILFYWGHRLTTADGNPPVSHHLSTCTHYLT